MKPAVMNPPQMAIPNAKLHMSPIIPINIGTRPPPTRNAMGTMSETAMLLNFGGTMKDRAAKAAGKKQTATRGCKKTIMEIEEVGEMPKRMVMQPVIKNTIFRIRCGPKRSAAQPPANDITKPESRDSAIRLLARFRSIACSATR